MFNGNIGTSPRASRRYHMEREVRCFGIDVSMDSKWWVAFLRHIYMVMLLRVSYFSCSIKSINTENRILVLNCAAKGNVDEEPAEVGV